MEPARDGANGNFAKIERAAVSVAAFGATLLVTPELSLTGYADLPDLAEPGDGPLIARLIAIAKLHGLAIIAGFPERKIDMVFNGAVFVQPDGKRKSIANAIFIAAPNKPCLQSPTKRLLTLPIRA